jgi:hypothetical protein
MKEVIAGAVGVLVVVSIFLGIGGPRMMHWYDFMIIAASIVISTALYHAARSRGDE